MAKEHDVPEKGAAQLKDVNQLTSGSIGDGFPLENTP